MTELFSENKDVEVEVKKPVKKKKSSYRKTVRKSPAR